jgi:fumarylacetoacetase
MLSLNETHDPLLKSWVASANDGKTDFPIQNLPFAIFKRAGTPEKFRAGVAIGDQIVDLKAAHKAGVFPMEMTPVLKTLYKPTLNKFMGLGHATWSELRLYLSRALHQESTYITQLESCLVPQSQAEYDLPARIGDYTDFYTSIHHATNVGKLFRPDNPLLPNYKWLPIGYHGRSSSIKVSGHEFHRPVGQLKAPDADAPVLAPCKRLDYELEVGIYIGEGNEFGEPISIDDAENHVFGLGLFNDWSARDIQAWEYQPLGPFLAKNFASTVSPWIITMEALAPFRQAWSRDENDPLPLAYLDSNSLRSSGAVDMRLEVHIQTAAMREAGLASECMGISNFNESYWSVSQMVTHHSVNGCNLMPGDLFGSGTMSGPNPDSVGALLEATSGGKHPINLSNGEQRTFLEDGDTVILKGACINDKAVRIGFGEAVATVLPAK